MTRNYLIIIGIIILSSVTYIAHSQERKNHKILIVVTSNDTLKGGGMAGYFLPEVTDYYWILSQFNYQIDIASIKGGKAPMYNRKYFVEDSTWSKYLETMNILPKLDNSIPLKDVDISEYSAIHCVGGYATLFDFPTDQTLKKAIKAIYNKNGVISAVCHGPSALLNVKLDNGKYLLEGLKITSRTTEEETNGGKVGKDIVLKKFPILLEEELIKQGAIFTKGSPDSDHIEVSDKIVTGQGPRSTLPMAKKVAELLKGKL